MSPASNESSLNRPRMGKPARRRASEQPVFGGAGNEVGPGVQADDHMAEAVRKILRYHFAIMLAHEAGTRSGEDIEDLHDMRVATRRMRSALRLFGSYFQPKAIRRFQKDLRKAGRALGRVRDLDVFDHKARKYLKKAGQGQDLTPLLQRWHQQREEARQGLIAYLDSKRYRRFVSKFDTFLRTENAGVPPLPTDEPVRVQVRHVLSSSVWQLYETVRAYEVILDDTPVTTLHALRIDCKRLRYTLEFFREVLGPETEQVIRDVIAIQDHLGNLQDADVAVELLSNFLDEARQQGELSKADLAGVRAYLRYRRQEARRLQATFPEVWPRLNSRDFRERLAAALLAL